MTYGSRDKAGHITQGGYSTQIVVDENYGLKVPDALSSAAAAPLLCAGITTYSPLLHWGVGKEHKLGVVGLGGLGHMAVKFGKALGAEVTVLSTSDLKQTDAFRIGAANFALTSDGRTFTKFKGYFNYILNTVSAPIDYSAYLNLLQTDGTMILVGIPDRPIPLSAFPLVFNRRRIAGSLIGGIRETQAMLDFCAEYRIASDVEIIAIERVNEAYERLLKGEVRCRFVIDLASLN